MNRYRIVGVHDETGEDQTIHVNAADERGAIDAAREQHVMVAEVRLVRGDLNVPDEPVPEASSLDDPARYLVGETGAVATALIVAGVLTILGAIGVGAAVGSDTSAGIGFAVWWSMSITGLWLLAGAYVLRALAMLVERSGVKAQKISETKTNSGSLQIIDRGNVG